MTISPDDLKKALSLITKQERKTIDLAKVANALMGATHEAISGEGDPEARIDSLVAQVDKIATILDSATEDANGVVSIAVTEGVTKFDIFADSSDPATPPPSAPASDGASATTDEGASATDADGLEKWDDDDKWEHDMAPAQPPLRKSERMTAGMRPVPARVDALSHVQKRYADPRDKVFKGERCLS